MPRTASPEKRIREVIAQHVERLVSDIAATVRQQIANEVRGGSSTVPTGGKRRRKPQKKISMTCIAPKCKQRSKGPRFHYLCEKHMDTPKRIYTKWRENARE
jgi:hypothetical protein